MAKEEILVGLKNALDRGQSLESAMQSLISAGYDINEVKDSAQNLNINISSPQKYELQKLEQSNPQPSNTKPIQQQIISEQNNIRPTNTYQQLPTLNTTNQQIMQNFENKPKRKMRTLLIVLIIIVLILIGGIITLSLLGPAILDALFK